MSDVRLCHHYSKLDATLNIQIKKFLGSLQLSFIIICLLHAVTCFIFAKGFSDWRREGETKNTMPTVKQGGGSIIL